ncbi:MAG: DUF4382 domain-containing protein [Longimicrobiales bacterium]
MRRTTFMMSAITALLAIGACDNADSDLNGLDRGRLTIQLTDAPGDLAEAFVKIDRFILIRGDEDSSDESGRIELTPLQAGFIELLVLAGGKVLNVVDEADVPEGTYSQLRVVVDEAFVRLKDGRVFATPGATLPAGVTADGELKCPSCSQSGFKVKFSGGGLVVDDNSIVVIDFDAANSFGHEAGKSGMWIMHPVLRATANTIELGKITGNVTLATGVTLPACGGQPNLLSVFRPTAATGTDIITGVTDELGVYVFSNVVPANYTLGFLKDVTYTNGDSLTIAAAATPPSVTVAPGATANANYQITAATCH